ncbi:MAG: DNA cytosine methyltransferase [Verrucomicrobia bacterium]|nr:DNA cytosine methyltransferase [Verrucomicrobiota bacterium]
MNECYPVIDLFAGPGGLGEGFSAFKNLQERNPFRIVLSIEKDPYAHATLVLRSFFRKFEFDKIPIEYWLYLNRKITKEELFKCFPIQAEQAGHEAQCLELGKTPKDQVRSLISSRLNNSKKWLLVGGPPCQAYSIMGRSRMKSTNPNFEKDERHFLYQEYLKILADHKPPVFIMENVKGILSATHSGCRIIENILKDLRNPELAANNNGGGFKYRLFSLVKRKHPNDYEPKDFIVEAEKFGVPQIRHRVLILGIRDDIDFTPDTLSPKKAPNVAQVIGDLPKIRSGISKEQDSLILWKEALKSIRKEPWYIEGKLSGLEKTINKIEESLNLIEITENFSSGREFLKHLKNPKIYDSWFRTNCPPNITHHTARSHMRSDLHRYLFSSAFAAVNNRSPRLNDFPESLLPAHKNIQKGISAGHFNDRFTVQLNKKPSTTITSHISKDGHYFIHYDPLQCRSLTVREAARLQTFPDTYWFEGFRTHQYLQVGNAVPPLLACQIAKIVNNLLENITL